MFDSRLDNSGRLTNPQGSNNPALRPCASKIMREFLILILTGVCGYLAFQVHRQNQKIARLEGATQVAQSETKMKQEDRIGSEDRPFNQYLHAEKAFAIDELFAVTSKQIVPGQSYVDRFDKTVFGNPRTKKHPPVYVLRCLGRETRENYLFIVDRPFDDAAEIHQKFTKAEMSNWEFFLSEDKMHQKIFHRRFRNKMID